MFGEIITKLLIYVDMINSNNVIKTSQNGLMVGGTQHLKNMPKIQWHGQVVKLAQDILPPLPPLGSGLLTKTNANFASISTNFLGFLKRDIQRSSDPKYTFLTHYYCIILFYT